jgi:hypothetical protein
MGKTQVYYIVNPAGAVHTVTREHAAERLRQPGYRQATKDEIEQYEAQEIQRADRPIAKPWDPTPEPVEVEVEEPEKKGSGSKK